MVLENASIAESQLQAVSALEKLIGQKGLPGHLQGFLLSCKVDGLSPVTLRYYRQKLGNFVTFCEAMGEEHPWRIRAALIRPFLLRLQETNNPVHMTRRYASTVDSEAAVKARSQFSPVDRVRL
jgi:hypothetical protein